MGIEAFEGEPPEICSRRKGVAVPLDNGNDNSNDNGFPERTNQREFELLLSSSQMALALEFKL